MICERCGNEIKENARFCAVCGKAAEAGGDMPQNDNLYAHIPENKAEESAVQPAAAPDSGYRHIEEQTSPTGGFAQTASPQPSFLERFNESSSAASVQPSQTDVPKPQQTDAPKPQPPKQQGYFLTIEQIAKLRADERERMRRYLDEHKSAEKQFFGAGALVACMLAIAVLSVACGIFAGLYFSVI